MQNKYPLEIQSNTDIPKSLWLTKVALAVIVLGLVIVGKKLTLWPIVTWPMYGNYAPEYPSSTTSIEELRVVSQTGEVYRFLPTQLWTFEGNKTVSQLIEKAFTPSLTQSLDQTALVNLARHNLSGVNIEKIERWQLEWQVDPLAQSPIERNRPTRQVILNSFEVKSDTINSAQR